MSVDTGHQLNLELLKYTLGPISPFLEDPQVTDILIYGPARVYVKRQGAGIVKTDACWRSEEDLMIAAEAIAENINRRLDANNPILDSRLPDGSRVNIVIPPCYPHGACISIRLFPKERFSLDDLVRFGTIDRNGIEILNAVMKVGRCTLISGSVSSGKTTLLNVMCSSFIHESDIVVTVEDSREISLGNPLWAPLECRHALHEDDRTVTLQDLVRNSLRMNPRWIIVGEVRGAEALDLVRAFNTGHSGAGTIHANSAGDSLPALENLILQSGLDISARAVKELVARAIKIVIHVGQYPDDSRKVMEIAEVQGLDYQVSSAFPPYRIVPLYRFNFQGYDRQDKATGFFETLKKPSFLADFDLVKGLKLPEFWQEKK